MVQSNRILEGAVFVQIIYADDEKSRGRPYGLPLEKMAGVLINRFAKKGRNVILVFIFFKE